MRKLRFEIWKALDGYRWRFKARNGRVIASGEGYRRFRDAETAVELLMGSSTADVIISHDNVSWTTRNPKGRKR